MAHIRLLGFCGWRENRTTSATYAMSVWQTSTLITGYGDVEQNYLRLLLTSNDVALHQRQ